MEVQGSHPLARQPGWATWTTMMGLVDDVFLGQGFGQAFGQALGVAPGWALVATGLPLGLASVVVRAMQAMECPLA